MRAKLLRKHRKNKFIEFNTKTKEYRFRDGWHMVDGSNDGAYYVNTGWTKDLALVRHSVRKYILENATLDFKSTIFKYERKYIKLLK